MIILDGWVEGGEVALSEKKLMIIRLRAKGYYLTAHSPAELLAGMSGDQSVESVGSGWPV